MHQADRLTSSSSWAISRQTSLKTRATKSSWRNTHKKEKINKLTRIQAKQQQKRQRQKQFVNECRHKITIICAKRQQQQEQQIICAKKITRIYSM